MISKDCFLDYLFESLFTHFEQSDFPFTEMTSTFEARQVSQSPFIVR